MSAKIQVEFELLQGSLAKAFEAEMAKITGILTTANAAQAAARKKHSDDGTKQEVDAVKAAVAAIKKEHFDAETHMAQMKEHFKKKSNENEKGQAKRILDEITKLQEEFQNNKLRLAHETLSKEDAAVIAARQKQISADRAVMTTIALQNEEIAKRGAGIGVGIMGVGRNIEGIWTKAAGSVGKLAGGLALAAGAFGLANSATSEAVQQTAAYSATFLPLIGMTHSYVSAQRAAAIAKLGSAKAMAILNASIAANPVAWIIGGIAALIAIFVILYNKVEFVRNIIDKLWSMIKSGFTVLTDLIGLTSKEARAHEDAADAIRKHKEQQAGLVKGFDNYRKALQDDIESFKTKILINDQALKQGAFTAEQVKKANDDLIHAMTGRQRELNQMDERLKSIDKQIGKDKEKSAESKKAVDIQKALFDRELQNAENFSKQQQALIEAKVGKNGYTEEQYRKDTLLNEQATQTLMLSIAKDFANKYPLIKEEALDKAADFQLKAAKAGAEIAKNDNEKQLAEAKRFAERLKAIRDAQHKAMFTQIDAATENEVTLAQARHARLKTEEEQSQQEIYEIKRKGLMKQLMLAGLFSKEWLDIMKRLHDLDQSRLIESSKSMADSDEEGLKKIEERRKEFVDTMKEVYQSFSQFFDIGKNAEKEKREASKQHAEQIADFKGTLMERNKLEREHKEKLAEIDKQANDERLQMITDRIASELAAFAAGELAKLVIHEAGTATSTATTVASMGTITAAAVPAATATSIATFGGSTATGIAALLAALAAASAAFLFKKGGYTGSGDPSEEAGIVHKDEFVLPSGSFEVDSQGRLIGVKPRPGITDGMPYPQNITDGNPYGSTTSGKFDPRDITRSHSLHLMQSVDDGVTSGKGSFEEMMRSHSLHLMQSVDDGLANAKKDFEEMMRSHSLHLMQSVDDIVASGGGNGGVNGAILQTLKSIETKTGVVIDSRRNALSSMAERRALARETV